MTKLLDRNRALQDENNKLSRELSEAAGQTALMFEKIIMVTLATTTSLPPKLNQFQFVAADEDKKVITQIIMKVEDMNSFPMCDFVSSFASFPPSWFIVFIYFSQNKQMRGCKANWSNCDTIKREFTKAE